MLGKGRGDYISIQSIIVKHNLFEKSVGGEQRKCTNKINLNSK